ncbi:putative pentatricopeptide repeat-containing protein At5g47460 [Gastrolobium bilobum]|uniref:putative pentatricopeptide repeat-containing protein At5g47460 n=1 Tax=Gastrolobium bilobum TaxID=150636 RepID=UPI002AAFE050|nr:putative pentatricopeptide repeat-containing protein At5g47460 [Gastrolobium bilobum]
MRRFLCKEARKFEKPYGPFAFPSSFAYRTSLNHIHSSIGSNSFSWMNITGAKAHAKGGTNSELTLLEASRMLASGIKPNAFVLVHLVCSATDMGHYSLGQQFHGYVLRFGYCSHNYVSASLIRFYVRMHSLSDAHTLFVENPHPNVVSWNTLISGYVHAGQFRRALSIFTGLERSHICADAFSFTSALGACAQLSLLKLGSSIHSKIVKLGMANGTVVANSLIDMYGKCGVVEHAVRVFSEIIDKDVISWNSVIAASANNGNIELAYKFLHLMPNPDTISYNGLINGIAQAGNIEHAIQILSTMPSPNSSSWNSIITGLVNRNRAREAWDMFSKMHSRKVQMDEFTFSIILDGIAGLSAFTRGMLIHCCTIKCGVYASVVVGSALIDMYSKCGQVKNAESIFHALPNKNLVSWNAMISGHARNGDFAQVTNLFELLKMERDTKPDGITFLNLISACSHNQIPFEVAVHYFKSMINEHGIAPSIEHCCSMIRLMGQKGELWRAESMIHEFGFESYGVVWRALLGACGTQADLQVAEIAAAKVIELDRNEDYVYVMMSNMYASFGRWEDVNVIRGLMSTKRVRKEAGSSWIDIREFCTT